VAERVDEADEEMVEEEGEREARRAGRVLLLPKELGLEEPAEAEKRCSERTTSPLQMGQVRRRVVSQGVLLGTWVSRWVLRKGGGGVWVGRKGEGRVGRGLLV
jgi:hypothetical protein